MYLEQTVVFLMFFILIFCDSDLEREGGVGVGSKLNKCGAKKAEYRAF